jgi:hypothetical protein
MQEPSIVKNAVCLPGGPSRLGVDFCFFAQIAATQLLQQELSLRALIAIWGALETAQKYAEDRAGCQSFGTGRPHLLGQPRIPAHWVMDSMGVTRECYTT